MNTVLRLEKLHRCKRLLNISARLFSTKDGSDSHNGENNSNDNFGRIFRGTDSKKKVTTGVSSKSPQSSDRDSRESPYDIDRILGVRDNESTGSKEKVAFSGASLETGHPGDKRTNDSTSDVKILPSKSQNIESHSESTTSIELLKKTKKMFDRVSSQADGTDQPFAPDPRDKKSFAALLRESNFIACGDPNGRVVVGTIFEVLGDDLYIDFGGKFHCVCPRPQANPDLYRRGLEVRLKLFDTEISSRFLGAYTDNTLLEADAVLLGPSREQRKSSKIEKSTQ